MQFLDTLVLWCNSDRYAYKNFWGIKNLDAKHAKIILAYCQRYLLCALICVRYNQRVHNVDSSDYPKLQSRSSAIYVCTGIRESVSVQTNNLITRASQISDDILKTHSQ